MLIPQRKVNLKYQRSEMTL